jgi:hypothetical protein
MQCRSFRYSSRDMARSDVGRVFVRLDCGSCDRSGTIKHEKFSGAETAPPYWRYLARIKALHGPPFFRVVRLGHPRNMGRRLEP